MSKIAFLFPGQGAQKVGMAREICQELPAAKALFDRAADILGYDLADICFNGPADKLNSTVVGQPALYVSSMAAVEKIKAERPDLIDKCEATAGLSLGEYTAIAFAGACDFEEGLRLVQQRGEAMQDAADATASGMVSVLGLDADKVTQVCDEARVDGEVLQLANFLCPGNIVVSGNQASCDRVDAIAMAAGSMKTVALSVAGAFHTPLMESAVSKLETALSGVNFQATKIPVYSNVDAKPHQSPEEFKDLLPRQVCQSVQWNATMDLMLEEGFDQFYEIGVGRVLTSLLKRIKRKIPCEPVLG